MKRPEDQLAVIARKPLGIAHASSGITTVAAATGSTTSFTRADILSAYLALPAAYRPYASWLLHPDDFGRLAALADTAGGLVFPTLQADPPTLISVKRLDELQRFYVTGVTDPLRKSPNAAERALAAGDGKSGCR